MAYQALYRKYRPRVFADVLGQEHITTVLKNQIINDQVTHAYIFSGTRGTGKTSTAKIFSRAVNCTSPVDGEPCGKCAACIESAANSVDIVEIDAASNNGVDNIRSLIDKARFTPLSLTKKVYIIDEVHELSGAAFNALLKTIEEPPAHVLFILATTEPQKIPATIASRCQRFDFHRIGVNDILRCMKTVLDDVGAKIDDEGMLAIARAADGGMRDALSIADQCISFYGTDVSVESVYRMLGSMDASFMFEAADALIDCDKRAAIGIVERVMDEGRDISVFTLDLTRHFRSLLITRLCGHCSDILDCTEDAMRRFEAQAKRVGEATLLRAIDLLIAAQGSIRYLSLPRIQLESTLLRIATPEEEGTGRDALAVRVEQLERKLEEGVKVAVSASAPAAVQAPWESAPAASAQAQVAPVQTAPLQAQAAQPAPAQTAPTQTAPTQAAPAQNAKALWKALYDKIHVDEPGMATMLLKGTPTRVENDALYINYESKIFYMAATKPENAAKLNAALSELQSGFRLECTLNGASAGGGTSDKTIDSLKSAFGAKLQILE